MKEGQMIIVGAGLAGALLAIMLRRAGYQVTVLERRADPRIIRSEGRSINLALSHRGIKALQSAGVYDQICAELLPMKGRYMHMQDGQFHTQPYGKSGQFINSVSRKGLNDLLITEAEKLGVVFYFEHRCIDIDFDTTTVKCDNRSGETTFKGEVIFGTDGAFSAVRSRMQLTDRFNYEQRYIEHGYKELRMPARDGFFAMDPAYLHIWPRKSFMLIALPNPDHSFTCTLFFPFEGDISFEKLQDDESVTSFFSHYFPDIPQLIPDYQEQFFKNPTSSLVTVKAYPWHRKNTLLLGDAAHAIVPFYGQGMNASFEDCRLLMEMAESHHFDWQITLPEFSKMRKKDGDAIAELALRNFVEMRDAVADDAFLERKKVDAIMHDLFPEFWIPMYTMVTFTDIPYHVALAKGIKQEQLLTKAQQQGYLHDYERLGNEWRFIASADF